VLKKMFLGVLFAILFSVFLIVGINLNMAKGTEYDSLGTSVGGIIWENTTWTLENSPYIITDTVQIPEDVTLTIEPGVTVIRPTSGDMFLVNGVIYAHGTTGSKIIFDGGENSNFFCAEGSNENTFLDLDYCIIRNGISFCPQTGNTFSHISLTHCELINLTRYSQLYHSKKGIDILYNKFINAAGFLIPNSYGSNIYIKNNLFKGNKGFVVESVSSFPMIVKYNSFIDMEGIVLRLGSYGAMNATKNYWGTQDTDLIDSMIYDRNDDITCADFIEYLPILTEPHPDTPILLEDINVDINGIFRYDDDGKWRCYANITIKNNSYRNVTIRWVYLNAINITYTDETFEELNIPRNETLNYVIQPEQELSVNWNITAFGFTKEPKILWVLFKTPISEAYGTITLTTVILEFPSFLILPLFMIATLLAVIVYRRKRVLA